MSHVIFQVNLICYIEWNEKAFNGVPTENK